jgi:hypothetical protein
MCPGGLFVTIYFEDLRLIMLPPTISRYQIRTTLGKGGMATVSSARPGGINGVRVGWFALGLVLLVGFVFLGVSGCASRGLILDEPFVTVTPPLTPTLTQTPTQTPTRTRTPTPSPEFPSGSATILQMKGQISVQVTGQPPQFAEPGLTIPVSGEIAFITNGIAELELSDGTRVFLGENTTVTLVSVAGTSGLDTVIQIQQGSILVGAALLTISASTAETGAEIGHPFQAQVTGGWMGVTYQPETGQFLVDCLSAACQVGDLALRGGQRGGFTDSILGEPEDAQYDFWRALSLFEVPPTATLAPTSTPTPTHTPTPLAGTSVPPLAPTATPKEEPPNPPASPTPKPMDTPTSVPPPPDTPTSVSPP